MSFDFIEDRAYALSIFTDYQMIGTGVVTVDAESANIVNSLYCGELYNYTYAPVSVSKNGILNINFLSENSLPCTNKFAQTQLSNFNLNYTDNNFETSQLRTYPTSIFKGNDNLNYIFSYTQKNITENCSSKNQYWKIHSIDGTGNSLWEKEYSFENSLSNNS